MSKNQAQPITTPSVHRPATNVGASDIAEGYVLKGSGQAARGVDLATSNADVLYGVAVEAIGVGQTKSAQREGRARVLAGAAVARLARVTVDATGRAITKAAGTDVTLGTAETPAAQAGDWFEVELDIA